MQSLQIALITLIGSIIAIVALHVTGVLPAWLSSPVDAPAEPRTTVATSTQAVTPATTTIAKPQLAQPAATSAVSDLGLATTTQAVPTTTESTISSDDDVAVSPAAMVEESIKPPPAPTGSFTVRANSRKFNSSRWVPIPNITQAAAGRLCALAVGHVCAWNDEFLQQTATFADIVTDQQLSVSVVTEASGTKVVLADPARHDGGRYRLYAATYDILGRPDRVYELHVSQFEVRGTEVWFDWDYEVRFVDEQERILSTALPSGFKVSIIAMSVDSGAAGHKHHVPVPGQPDAATVAASIPALFPNHFSQFYNLTAVPAERGRLVDGGDGFDTVEYTEPLASKSFVVGLNTETNQNVVAVVVAPDFIDVLINIEQLKFSDQEILVSELRTAVAQNPNQVVYADGQPAVPGLLR